MTEPLETIVKAINGVEHVYSQTQDDQVLVTARFLVGTKSDEAILRVHEKVRANMDRIPIGIPEPLIVGRGIDDVAIVSLTLAPKPEAAERWTDNSLYHLAENLRIELVKIDNVGLTYIVGGRPDQIRVEPDPEKLSLYGVTLAQLVDKVRSANRSFLAGQIRDQGRAVPVVAGQTLQGVPDIGLLLLPDLPRFRGEVRYWVSVTDAGLRRPPCRCSSLVRPQRSPFLHPGPCAGSAVAHSPCQARADCAPARACA